MGLAQPATRNPLKVVAKQHRILLAFIKGPVGPLAPGPGLVSLTSASTEPTEAPRGGRLILKLFQLVSDQTGQFLTITILVIATKGTGPTIPCTGLCIDTIKNISVFIAIIINATLRHIQHNCSN